MQELCAQIVSSLPTVQAKYARTYGIKCSFWTDLCLSQGAALVVAEDANRAENVLRLPTEALASGHEAAGLLGFCQLDLTELNIEWLKSPRVLIQAFFRL